MKVGFSLPNIGPVATLEAVTCGSLEQIADDVRGCGKIGASEIFFNPGFSPGGQSLEHWLSLLEQLQGMTKVS